MNTPLGNQSEYKEKLVVIDVILGTINGPFDKNPTRWDELCQTVSIVVDISSV